MVPSQYPHQLHHHDTEEAAGISWPVSAGLHCQVVRMAWASGGLFCLYALEFPALEAWTVAGCHVNGIWDEGPEDGLAWLDVILLKRALLQSKSLTNVLVSNPLHMIGLGMFSGAHDGINLGSRWIHHNVSYYL